MGFATRGVRASPARASLVARARVAPRAAWVFGTMVLAALGLRPWFGDELFVTRYTGYVMPWLLAGLVPGAVWAGLTKRMALAALLAASGAVIVTMHLPLFSRRGATSLPAAVTIHVMSYNTWSRNAEDGRIAGVVRDHVPDLLLLQEIPPDSFARLVGALRGLYDGSSLHWAYEPALQQGVVSRYRLESRGSMKEKGQAQKVVVSSPAGPITVFNVHPLRTGGWRNRYRQITSLLEEDVFPERSPVILAGDLNVNDRSQLYAAIARRLVNAHEAAGFGFGFTYPSAVHVLANFPALPMARIDHVFFSEHFVAVRAGTVQDSGGSDHRPVFAELALPVPNDGAAGSSVGAPARQRGSMP